MNKIVVLLILTLSIFQPLFALLSPLNQSIVEIEEILKSPELNQPFPQNEPIQSIQKNENEYEIRTETRTLNVTVEYLKNQMPGAQQFRLHFNQ